MMVIYGRNVNRAFANAGRILVNYGKLEETRNGPALVIPEPVCTTYTHPRERVLFYNKRRANPFFHLFEAFWMLAGRRDAKFLNRYVHDFGSRYAEDDGNLHGAYGYRWREHFGCEQIEMIINQLTEKPASRQAVLAMWDPEFDLTDGQGRTMESDLNTPKDLPCNTHIYFRRLPPDGRLDMLVCCRSNDAVWGAYGANAVHMSVLHEFVAWRIGCELGTYRQLSNNLHLYISTKDRIPTTDDEVRGFVDPYTLGAVAAYPLFANANSDRFDDELSMWMYDPSNVINPDTTEYFSPVFEDLLIPMSRVHDAYKKKDYTLALGLCKKIQAEDWRMAASLFVDRGQGGNR